MAHNTYYKAGRKGGVGCGDEQACNLLLPPPPTLPTAQQHCREMAWPVGLEGTAVSAQDHEQQHRLTSLCRALKEWLSARVRPEGGDVGLGPRDHLVAS